MSEPASPASTGASSTSSTSYVSSPYRRRRHHLTRREALDRILKSKTAAQRLKHPDELESSERSLLSPTDEELSLSAQKNADILPLQRELTDFEEATMERKSGKDERKIMNGEVATATTASISLPTVQRQAMPGYAALADDSSSDQVAAPPRVKKIAEEHTGEGSDYDEGSRLVRTHNPLHLETHDNEQEQADAKYYRITYQGVVALLSDPNKSSTKSGAYVSYGEVVMSRYEKEVEDDDSEVYSSADLSPRPSDVGSPPQSVLSQNTGSVSSLDTFRTASTAAPSQVTQSKSLVTSVAKRLVRVDDVLTGGYSVDASENSQQYVPDRSLMSTPKRSNLHHIPMVGPSPLPLGESKSVSAPSKFEGGDDSSTTRSDNNYGYLYTRKQSVAIAEQLSSPPMLQRGTFLFKIVSPAPLPILTGPCVDAPKTRAVLLPGTVHEVCLKMMTDDCDLCFLRLSHRRGWISDRRVTSLGGLFRIGAVPAAKEITDSFDADDNITISQTSLASASIASTGSSVRRRHRPPRRKREAVTTVDKSGLPRHVGLPQHQVTPARGGTVTPQKAVSPRLIGSPSTNVSILSDDESFDLGCSYRFPSGSTPDRYVAQSKQQQRVTTPTVFLMQVNAPRGLKILDAPHFQVSNLIHGKNDAKSQIPPQILNVTSSKSSKGASSIFQTMGVHHTTKGTNQARSPAVFDSVTKTRILPRGAMFEASKRMEAPSAFHRGAGLIKLSDNSGWAIIPRQDELEAQYRNYQGGAMIVKDGEVNRAFEEVGNAIVDEAAVDETSRERPSVWVRVVAKNGVTVACPPPDVPVASDDDTSPTSSAEGSSFVSGGGSNYGVLSGGDSDVASSVGSAFLDAMFRTPKKRDPAQSIENRPYDEGFGGRRDRRPAGRDLQIVPNILPCGSCVEVDRWENGTDGKAGSLSQGYVRLCGGQGWIPLQAGGKTVSAAIPKPDIRIGSFWFRVSARPGIKVRLGPSRKAGSIKSDDGTYFRFECGEFLRASEVVTVHHDHGPSESYAKLYRNRHVRLNADDGDYRQLISLTTPAEWVQVHSDISIFLEECGAEPQISRHREGWRYNVVADHGIDVRTGPSFDAEASGVSLLVGESVLITEQVIAPGESITWLRLKDGEGWVYDKDVYGRNVMIAHSLRHRPFVRPQKSSRPEQEDIAYNTIVARLFHEGAPGSPSSEVIRNKSLTG